LLKRLLFGKKKLIYNKKHNEAIHPVALPLSAGNAGDGVPYTIAADNGT